MRWIKRILLFLLFLLVTAIGTGVFITVKYGDDLEAYVLNSVRSIIITDVRMSDDAEFSLWEDFPLVSVELKQVYIQDSFRSDTLLSAKQAFAQLNVFKILRNDFTIEGIRLKDGLFRLKRNRSGDWNFKVWKDISSDGKDKSSTDFNIEILTLENIYLDYDDRNIDLNIQFNSEKSKLKGQFTKGDQRFSMSFLGFMPSLTTAGDVRILNLPLSLAGVLHLNFDEKVYTVEMGNAVLAGNEMIWDAEWKQVEEGTNMHLKAVATNIDPEVLLPHVWPQMPEAIINLKLKGKSDLTVTMDGPFTLNSGPNLDAAITMRNGQLLFRNTEVSNFNVESHLLMKDVKRSKAIELTFSKFDLKTDKGTVSGKGKLVDLTNPYLYISTEGNSRIEEILNLADVKEGISGSGNVTWKIDFEGPLGADFQTSKEDLKQMKWAGTISFSEAELITDRGIPPITKLNGSVVMTADETIIEECNATIGHLELSGSVRILQLKQILTDNAHPVNVSGKLKVAEMDISKLPLEWKFTESAEDSPERQVSLDVGIEIGTLVYRDFVAKEITGELLIKDEMVIAKELKFNALNGSIVADLTFRPYNENHLLDISAKLKRIDISRLLSEWNEFGQKTVTSKHLKGLASASMDITALLDPKYQLIRNKLRVEADLEITNGELIKFEPLQALSKFISVDELNHVKFDTLRNHIAIKDDKLIIPRMSVSSNILNVDVFGEHGFNQELDYHVNLLLNDLLRRKAKRQQNFDGHEIVDERGKTRLFLWIRGTPGNIKVGFYKKEVRTKVKQDLKTEGQTIKQLFREEFGGAKSTTEPADPIRFRLEDEGSDDAKKAEPETGKKKKKKKGVFGKEPEKEETEGGFEIEFEP